MSGASELSAVTALVVDDNHYQRGISIDILRTIGLGRVVQAANGEDGWEQCLLTRPGCVFTDWLPGSAIDGVELIRRIRQADESPNRSASIFLLTSRASQADVEAARAAGADAFLRKPVSVLAVRRRLLSVVNNPQPFIETGSYVGPCRRRRNDPFFAGPFRRLTDRIEESIETGEDDAAKVDLCKQRIDFLEQVAHKLDPADPNTMRRLFQAALDLKSVAEKVGDTPLELGASELVRYLQISGATAGLDFEAMKTHIAALHQLVHLPNAMQAERIRVAQNLTKMVDKKLKRAAG